MELDSRKKSRRHRMMYSKSYEMQVVRDRPGGSRRVERLSHLVDRNNRCLPDERKGMQRPGKIEDVKIHARVRKMLWHGIDSFVWASDSGGGKVGGNRKKFSEGERRAEG